ncbi:hypothetical protein N7541_005457 [Penicillium brevicompactum]|uniref:Uncharacterized protein n=1 Tax=Penicillium brevicompactum TaxID=5074 RepID=A0A9W9UVP7_PENBR|nr:hypothetical protein N7541_005457 [Penicillium brevicompactum]
MESWPGGDVPASIEAELPIELEGAAASKLPTLATPTTFDIYISNIHSDSQQQETFNPESEILGTSGIPSATLQDIIEANDSL